MKVGHVVSASATATVQLRPSMQLRGSCFCSAIATRAEVGVSIARSLTRGYLGVGYGTAGTSLNVRLTRAGHTMHVPILLSSRFDDWRALLLGAAVPTVLNVFITQCAPHMHDAHASWIQLRESRLARRRRGGDPRWLCRGLIRPVLWAMSARTAQAAREERRAEIAQARSRALRQQAVMGATVARMAAKEEHKSGFVIVLVRTRRSLCCLCSGALQAPLRVCVFLFPG